MSEKVYEIIELVGTSEKSMEHAIDNAIAKAAESKAKICWYEVLHTRGHVENNKTKYYQVTVKIGCH